MAKKATHNSGVVERGCPEPLELCEDTDVRPADCEKPPRTAGAVSQKAFAFCESISLRSHCAHGGVYSCAFPI
jgi:hypothetical protein